MQSLDYNKSFHVVVKIIPETNHKMMRIDYKIALTAHKCALFEDESNSFVVPCYIVEGKGLTGTTMSKTYCFEQIKVPRDFGTYELMPKKVSIDMLNRFIELYAPIPSFEGYFSSLALAVFAKGKKLPDMIRSCAMLRSISNAKIDEIISTLRSVKLEDHICSTDVVN